MMNQQFRLDLLDREPSAHKAFVVYPGLGMVFGTTFMCSLAEGMAGVERRARNQPQKSPLALHHPNLTSFLGSGCRDIALPADWTQETLKIDDDTGFGATFVAHWLEWPTMKLGAFQENGGKVPTAAGLLLSGYLQLDEAINWRNFLGYQLGVNLKFLPMVITPTGLRFYMYRPGTETMRAAIIQFQEVLRRLEAITSVAILNSLLRDVYAAVLLSQTQEVLGDTPSSVNGLVEVRSGLQSRFETSMKLFQAPRKCLGFVYQGQLGSQTAQRFSSDMFVRRER